MPATIQIHVDFEVLLQPGSFSLLKPVSDDAKALIADGAFGPDGATWCGSVVCSNRLLDGVCRQLYNDGYSIGGYEIEDR